MQQRRLGSDTQRKQRDHDHVEQQLYAELCLRAKRQLEVACSGPRHTAPGATRRQLGSGGGSLRHGSYCKRSDWIAAAGNTSSWWVAITAIPPCARCAASCACSAPTPALSRAVVGSSSIHSGRRTSF